MTISELAAEMNVTEADVSGFVAALSVWIAKGLTFEQAIKANLAHMQRLAAGALDMASGEEFRATAIDWFYEEAA